MTSTNHHPLIPEWAEKQAFDGPFQESDLKYTNHNQIVVLSPDIHPHEALTGWAKLMFRLTDGVVSSWRTDMVHDSVRVAELIEGASDFVESPDHVMVRRLVRPIEFLYEVRPTGTGLWTWPCFTGVKEVEAVIRAMGATNSWIVSLGVQTIDHTGRESLHPKWVWMAEGVSFDDPKRD